MNKKILILSIMLIAVFATSFSRTTLAIQSYKNIPVEKTQRMVFSNGHPDLIVIDLRPVSMFQGGHIPGAINVPMPVLEAWILGEGQDYLNKKLIVHCHLEIVSPVAAQMLVDAGFKKVNNMKGGFMAWLSAGQDIDP